MLGVKLDLICSDWGPRRAAGIPAIRLGSSVSQETARPITLPLLFVKGVILPFHHFTSHQSSGTSVTDAVQKDKQRQLLRTPPAGARPSSMKSSGRHAGATGGVTEVEITQLLQFDLSIRPRPPSFTRSADGHHFLLSGLFQSVTDEVL